MVDFVPFFGGKSGLIPEIMIKSLDILVLISLSLLLKKKQEQNIETLLELAKFNHIKFDSESHKYYYNNEKEQFPLSVTEKVHQFVAAFDKGYWSQRKAKERGVAPEVVLAEWDKTAEEACTKGTAFHKYAENKVNNRHEPLEVSALLKSQFDRFYYDSIDNLVPVKSELVVGDTGLQIAGTVDQLYWSKKINGFVIFDWKTNRAMRLKNERRQKMLTHFAHLDECEFNTYSLQLNIYKYIVERNTSLKIKGLFLGWFNEKNDSYQIHKCLDLQSLVPQIF